MKTTEIQLLVNVLFNAVGKMPTAAIPLISAFRVLIPFITFRISNLIPVSSHYTDDKCKLRAIILSSVTVNGAAERTTIRTNVPNDLFVTD